MNQTPEKLNPEKAETANLASLELKANLNQQQREYLKVLKDKMKKILGNHTARQLARAGDLESLKKYNEILNEILRFLRTKEMGKNIDYDNFECLQELKGHEGYVPSVFENHDQTKIISAGADHTIKVWDRVAGQCIENLKDHSGIVRKVKESKDGKYFFSTSNDGTIRMWDQANWKCIKIFETGEEKSPVFTDVIEYSDNILISTELNSRELKLWDRKGSGSTYSVIELPWEVGEIYGGLKISDENQLALSAANGVTIFNLNTNEVVDVLNKDKPSQETAITESADQRYLFVGAPIIEPGGEGNFDLQIWDKKNWELVASLPGHDDIIRSIVQTRDGNHLITCSDDKTVKIWDLDRKECIKTFEMNEHQPKCVAESANGDIITSGRDGTIRIWGEKDK